MNWIHSLTFKLSAAFLIVALTGTVLIAVFVGRRTVTEFDRFLLDRNQEAVQAGLADYYRENDGWDGIVRAWSRGPGGQDNQRNRFQGRIPATLIDENGNIRFNPGPNRAGRPATPQEIERGTPVEVDGRTVGLVVFDAPRGAPLIETPEADFLRRVNNAIAFSALGAIAVAALLGFVLARTITRPVRELTVATQAVALGDLGREVPVHSKDELGELATSFNRMSGDLARANQLRRQMTADVAHDLRTPLSVILGYAEALSDGKLQGTPEMYGVIHQEANHLNHLIDDLRTLSLADAGELHLQPSVIPAAECLTRAAAAHQVLAQELGVQLRVEMADDLPAIFVDSERIAQVMGNLVGNALRHTPRGGEVVLAGRSNSDRVELSVTDTGPGIAASDLPNIFERFYRGDSSRSQNGASGLGLPIARSIVEAHGGAITVQSAIGHGARFTVALPARGDSVVSPFS